MPGECFKRCRLALLPICRGQGRSNILPAHPATITLAIVSCITMGKKGFELISGMPLLNWVRFHGESGGYNVSMQFDPITPYNPTGKRTKFRFQLEGPNAVKVLDAVTQGGWPELKFFRTATVEIAGRKVLALCHGMGQTGGAELSGDYADLEIVRDAILKAGETHGIRQAGTLTYFNNAIIAGWVPYPLPRIYTGEELRKYRQWLPSDSLEANMQLAGSLYSENIEDYYWTPSALGYDRFVKFNHDFVGREALESAQRQAASSQENA